MKETHRNYRVSTWPSPRSTALWFWTPLFEVVEPRLQRGGVKVRLPAQVNQGNDTAVDTTAFTKPRFSQLPFKATRTRPVPVTDTFFCVPRLSAHESFRCTRAEILNRIWQGPLYLFFVSPVLSLERFLSFNIILESSRLSKVSLPGHS